MADQTPLKAGASVPAPIATAARPAPIALNKVCLYTIGAIGVADVIALIAGVPLASVSGVSAAIVTGLFAVIDRGAAGQ